MSDCLDFFSSLGVDGEGGSEVVERGSSSLSNIFMDGVGCGESGHSYEGAEGDALEEEWEGCDVGMGDRDFCGCR